ncbi:MAG TPA: hypothetical protein VF544_21280 [Pyrinomonadaceae bacterium]|jgi:hypothetical protein
MKKISGGGSLLSDRTSDDEFHERLPEAAAKIFRALTSLTGEAFPDVRPLAAEFEGKGCH